MTFWIYPCIYFLIGILTYDPAKKATIKDELKDNPKSVFTNGDKLSVMFVCLVGWPFVWGFFIYAKSGIKDWLNKPSK